MRSRKANRASKQLANMTDIKITPAHFKKITGVEFDKIGKKFPDLLGEDGELKEDADIGTAVVALVAEKASAQHSRGKREALESVEEELTALGVTDIQNAKDGLKALAQRIKGDPGKDPNPAELTPEQVMKHPAFAAAVEDKVKALKDAKDALEQEFTTYKTGKEQEAKNIGRRTAYLKVLKAAEMNASFGAVGEEEAMSAFLALHPDKFVNDAGIVVDEKGAPILDAQFNQQTATDFLNSKWLFGFNAAPAHQSPPPANGGGNGSTAPKYNITSKAQFEELLAKADKKDKADLWASYNAVADKIK